MIQELLPPDSRHRATIALRAAIRQMHEAFGIDMANKLIPWVQSVEAVNAEKKPRREAKATRLADDGDCR